ARAGRGVRRADALVVPDGRLPQLRERPAGRRGGLLAGARRSAGGRQPAHLLLAAARRRHPRPVSTRSMNDVTAASTSSRFVSVNTSWRAPPWTAAARGLAPSRSPPTLPPAPPGWRPGTDRATRADPPRTAGRPPGRATAPTGRSAPR